MYPTPFNSFLKDARVFLKLVFVLGALIVVSLVQASAPHHNQVKTENKTGKGDLAKLNNTEAAKLRRQAQLHVKSADYKKAEKFYLQLLDIDLDKKQRREVLLEMVETFRQAKMPSKMATIYEKFLEVFPEDPLLPRIYIELGVIYRDMGVNQKALTNFYNVLNLALKIPEGDMEEYKKLTLMAQLEIVETHFLERDYKNTEKYLKRLKDAELNPNDRINSDFRYAQIPYLEKDYKTAIPRLASFIKTHSKSKHIPEAHFLLAVSYKEFDQPEDALEEILKLMRHEDVARNSTRNELLEWKFKAGNVLGGQFYEQGDFFSALKIYQAMVKISDHPRWQWPSIYQIGLCFERLRMPSKAMEAYNLLVNPEETKMSKLPKDLLALQESSSWRLKQLKSISGVDKRLQRLLLPEPNKIRTSNNS